MSHGCIRYPEIVDAQMPTGFFYVELRRLHGFKHGLAESWTCDKCLSS